MKPVLHMIMAAVLLGILSMFSGGCGPVPYCDTSLVTLDETRLDVENYEQEAAETAQRVAELEKQLAETRKNISDVESRPAELEEKVNELKKGSGRE
ncbi:MAG: hypothetical protein JW876_03090 [Candidatus Krumholzibacteriota bacterium]|nr:hypothetical protein [Candidatus Krumholzibacteriota bacterium]